MYLDIAPQHTKRHKAKVQGKVTGFKVTRYKAKVQRRHKVTRHKVQGIRHKA